MSHRTKYGAPMALILIALLAISLLAGSGVSAIAGSGGSGGAHDPANFDTPQPNEYFPLEPGWSAVLRGTDGDKKLVERVVVTHRTKVIQGITTIVIRDAIRHKGSLVEKTEDWYAADNEGTVWYFGEKTAEYDENGDVISTAGSWEAGVDGAVAGIIMPADPQPTDAYRQEFYQGEAEDQGWVVERDVSVKVPYGRVTNAVRTFEWSRTEPDVMVGKVFGPGLGIAFEYTLAGGAETLKLVKVNRAGA